MNRWKIILEELDRLRAHEDGARQIVHRHVRSVPAREMGFEAVLRETRLRCAEYDSEIKASIAAWEWGKNLAMISPPAQLWRFVRAQTAMQWFCPAVECPQWNQIMGSPLAQDSEVIRWLLTEWWDLVGLPLRAMWEMGS